MAAHRPLPENVSFPALEEEILERWRERDVFRESMRRREGAEPFVFYEGPPTANGRPGSHHVLARVFKDIFPRYKTMRGRYVERKGGWDCHGLPVEIAVEQQLGFTSKADIERYGIAEFNQKCRESVFEFLEDWTRLTERIGYWVDLEHPYRTLDDSYIESVWWALAQLWERDLLYEGHKVVPYCPRDGTALSIHEVAQGYKDVEDPRVYVQVPGHRARRRAARGRRAAGLDHDALDAGLQRRRRRRPRAAPTCARPTATCSPRRWSSACSARTRRSPTASTGATCSAPRYEPPFPFIPSVRSTARRATPSCPATSSPPRTAPASSTPRSRSARTTSGSAPSRG